ncbi:MULTISPECIES: GLPGLI family protein [Amniculibacterium]|uniref:GLPGLI family protein n=1 Tax=Amniculibacterium TaxID=2715289 RepID=UPI000F5A2462|nr:MULTISPECIES: GLPGLI family protein [Amniculibacterium]
MKLLFFTLFSFASMVYAQKSFKVVYEADYRLVYKDLKNTDFQQEEAFALLMNERESYFKSMNKYIGDSLKFEKKITDVSDISLHMKYDTSFPENIGITSGKIYVTIPISDKNFKYEEQNDFNWKLHNEFKKIDKYTCQKATIKKYGRVWIAYFTAAIPLPFGPYKFNKLPGLILEVYDDKGDYRFEMYSFKKRKYLCKSANINANAKFVSKSKIFDYKRNDMANQDKYNDYIEDPETLKLLKQKILEKSKKYNPLELEL